jgi:hypothetical protein
VNQALAGLDGVGDAALAKKASRAQAELDALRPKRISTFDPNNLPFGASDGKVREPLTDPGG